MPAKYICPAQIRKNIHPFLMCEHLKKDGVDYNLRENALQIMCINQHYCPCTKQNENTAEYKACYANMTAAKSEPQEEKKETVKKVKRNKAKTNDEP